MRWTRDHTPDPQQNRLYRKALTITVAGNILLAIAKGIAAYTTGSAALFSDAANSLSDVIYSGMMVLVLWVALQPPDLNHPQGHSRFEPLVGLLVTFSMAFAGFEAARTSITRFIAGGTVIEPGLPMLVLVFSALTKTGMFFSIRGLARQVMSPTLNTTAKDNLTDVLASSAAFVGVAASGLIHPLFDPAAGLLVAFWILRAAFQAGRENLDFLTGAGASPELRRKIIDTAESVPGVLRVHHLMTEYSGPRLVADLHINVDGDTNLRDSHKITDDIIALLQAIPEIDRAYVHVEPDDWED